MRSLIRFLSTLALVLWPLFAPAEDLRNRIVHELPPSKATPRNSEGAFVTLKSGRILFVYSQFYGGKSDESAARLVSIYSEDKGLTWSKDPQTVIDTAPFENVMSVSLLRLHSGKIALIYLGKNSFHDCRPLVRFSTDEAVTWSEPVTMFTAPGYFVLNNDRIIQTATGRLIAPVAYHRGRNNKAQSHGTLDYRGINFWYLSDDEGKTWREADDWWAIPVRSRTGLHEPGVVELADGSLFSWQRTDQLCQYSSVSTNGGVNWSPPQPSSLHSPISPASIKRLPDSPDLLAIWNDHSGDFPFREGKRTPLVAGISSDGGRTWKAKKVLESDLNSFFCYTTIHFVDNSVLLAYSTGKLDLLRLRRVNLEWLKP